MTVIGRLDEQVDEVLITPLEKRREREAPGAPTLEGPAPPSSAPAPSGEASADETSRAAAELPVWLL
jgi:hypothetical protein